MNKKIRLYALIISTAVLLLIPTSAASQQVKIHILDVGQGDSVLIELPDSYYVLIDGGPNGKVLDELNQIMPFWERKLDLVMLTHPDSDHVSGLVDVLKSYKVDTVYTTGVKSDSVSYAAFTQEIKRHRIATREFVSGNILNYANEAALTGIWPSKADAMSLKSGESSNKTSQVGLLRFGFFEMLFTGDIDTDIATKVINQYELRSIDALKVPHHGSRFGIPLPELQKLSPKVSVISVGESNQYGHPAAETLQNLNKVNSSIFQTQRDGRVTIVADQAGFSIYTR